jgi:hypothetical protein
MEAPPPARVPVDRSSRLHAERGGVREEVNRRTRMILGESCFIPFLIGEGVQVELGVLLAEIFLLRVPLRETGWYRSRRPALMSVPRGTPPGTTP